MDIRPDFDPSLGDMRKQWGDFWQLNLTRIDDPANKYAFVSQVKIYPEEARAFCKHALSSNEIANATQIIFIEKNHFQEVTGNVSIFVTISAFNQNYSRFLEFRPETRS